MGLDSRAVVDEIGDFMRAYENTVVDIEGNTDSSGSREMNMTLSKQRADAVKDYLVEKYHFPPDRMRTIGNGPDQPLDDQRHSRRPREEPPHRYQGLPQPGFQTVSFHLFEIRREVSRKTRILLAVAELGAWWCSSGSCSPSWDILPPFSVPKPAGVITAFGAPLDGVRSAGQRLHELVAHRARRSSGRPRSPSPWAC